MLATHSGGTQCSPHAGATNLSYQEAQAQLHLELPASAWVLHMPVNVGVTFTFNYLMLSQHLYATQSWSLPQYSNLKRVSVLL